MFSGLNARASKDGWLFSAAARNGPKIKLSAGITAAIYLAYVRSDA
jgi:hypothetical protein